MKLLTYNILNGGTQPGGDDRLEQVLQVIAQQDPDIVLLNEARDFDADGRARLFYLERRLGMRGILAQAESGYHLAAFVRQLPIVRQRTFTRHMQHAALEVELEGQAGSLFVVATHLHPFGGQRRLEEAQFLGRYAGHASPLFLAGDMNSVSPHDAPRVDLRDLAPHRRIRHAMPDGSIDTRAIQTLENAGFTDLFVKHGAAFAATYPTAMKPGRKQLRLDYVFANPAAEKLTLRCEVIDNELSQTASDHLPVLVEFEPA